MQMCVCVSLLGCLWGCRNSYRGVGPIGVIKVEALVVFGLLGVDDG